MVGIYINLLFSEFVKKFRVYDDGVLCDIKKLHFRGDSFDVAVTTEVIRHVRKEEGCQFLGDLKRITKGRILINILLKAGIHVRKSFL